MWLRDARKHRSDLPDGASGNCTTGNFRMGSLRNTLSRHSEIGGQGAQAPCPPSLLAFEKWWARFVLPTLRSAAVDLLPRQQAPKMTAGTARHRDATTSQTPSPTSAPTSPIALASAISAGPTKICPSDCRDTLLMSSLRQI